MQQTNKKIIPFIPDGDFYYVRGVEAFQKRKFDNATKWLKKAIEANPNEPLYRCQLSVVYTELGLYYKANQELTIVLQSTEEYVDCYYLLANNYAHLGLLTEAKKYALAYLNKENDGDFTEEAEELLQLIEFEEEEEDDWELEDEDELLIYQETAFHFMENLDWNKALAVLNEMLILFPDHKVIRHEYAQALFFEGQHEEAIAMELTHLESEPSGLYSHTNLALFYYELGKKTEYNHYISKIRNVYPIHEQQKLIIATTLARTAQYAEANKRFRMIKQKTVSPLSYFRWYSLTLYEMGNISKAQSIWEIGCKKYPQLENEGQPWRN
ncbi:tetratricopeptide repeat protein [Virgibacillus soli]|uniref:Tetratricopeptide repeat protein n=1 Tax=Paracerasibacillus soli TaxID=480284 RepID=A0ABU5CR80_9BACI|nr:hypothetical protein [Virgibacillus soli]MDY0408874.1 hypothetical protein [Virgibacillus soli]